MKTALVHDWLVTEGGSEKVLKALAELFPGTLYTLFKGPLADPAIQTSFLQKIPGITKHYRKFLPLFPLAIESFDLSDYDLIISSSHCVAKSVRVKPHQTHICYCHTPMRYIWEQGFTPNKLLAKPFVKFLRSYDKKTASRVDHFIANSAHVADRIQRFYGRVATVIHPPVDTDSFHIASKRENYFFTCTRLVPYKKVDLLLETFAKLPEKRLLIVGEGSQKKSLQKKAPKNVTFLGYLPDDEYRNVLSKAKAFLHAAEEDFGIALVEAQSAGVPVIAYGVGGSRDIITAEKTGLLFDKQTPESLLETMQQFETMRFNPFAIKKHAEKFSKQKFQEKIRKYVSQVNQQASSCRSAFCR